MQPEMVTIACCNLRPLSSVLGEESTMSGFDWRSEEAYPDAKKAETADIAWEWLRRDRKYQRDYKALVSDQRSTGMTDDFRQQWGLSFRG
jgi:hypothetical protein